MCFKTQMGWLSALFTGTALLRNLQFLCKLAFPAHVISLCRGSVHQVTPPGTATEPKLKPPKLQTCRARASGGVRPFAWLAPSMGGSCPPSSPQLSEDKLGDAIEACGHCSRGHVSSETGRHGPNCPLTYTETACQAPH